MRYLYHKFRVLTKFASIVLDDGTQVSVRPLFFGASLLSFYKKLGLVRVLTKFASIVLDDGTQVSVCPLFFGASLLSFYKKDRDLRSIAIGTTILRFVAKTVPSLLKYNATALLRSHLLRSLRS
ncbi:hypothetical protein GJ496_001200 [Pomphorhynchus laevis]|nr:hypothetical protein GJ496_001200 [Pomphorhynchus laevis]